MIINQQNLGIYIFWRQMFFNNSFYTASHGAPINILIWTSFLFFFFQTFLVINWFPFGFHPWIFCHTLLLTCFQVSGCFLCFYECCKCWLMCISHVMCHKSQMSQITTWATTFMVRLFSVSKEWVRSWSHVFLITYQKNIN